MIDDDDDDDVDSKVVSMIPMLTVVKEERTVLRRQSKQATTVSLDEWEMHNSHYGGFEFFARETRHHRDYSVLLFFVITTTSRVLQ